MNGIAPMASGHFTHNKQWIELSDRVALGLKMLLSQRLDPVTREKTLRRVRRQMEVQATFRVNAAFDAQTDEIVAMRRHALATVSKAPSLARFMN